MALTTSDFSIRTLLLVAAAAPLVGRCGVKITRLLIVYNCIVESMQRPAESAKLQQELAQLQADLPHILLSYQELLAYFVKLASNEAAELMTTGDGSMASDIDAAYRWACPVIVGEHLKGHVSTCKCSCGVGGYARNPGDLLCHCMPWYTESAA